MNRVGVARIEASQWWKKEADAPGLNSSQQIVESGLAAVVAIEISGRVQRGWWCVGSEGEECWFQRGTKPLQARATQRVGGADVWRGSARQ